MPRTRANAATRFVAFGLPLAACAALGGCFGDMEQNRWKGGGTGPLFDSPFAPVSLRIHPLTHVDTAKTAGGPSIIVLHVELRDRWGDTAKGCGKFAVLLYKPGTGVAPGLETQELKWDVPNFDEPNANMSMYDAATRTYRIQLEAPEWVAKAIHDPKEGQPGWFTIRAVLSAGTDQDARYLSDEYVLQK